MNYASNKIRKVAAPAPAPKSLFCCGVLDLHVENKSNDRTIIIPGDKLALPDFAPEMAYIDVDRYLCLVKVADVAAGTFSVFGILRNGNLHNNNPSQMEIISGEKFAQMDDLKYGIYYVPVPDCVNISTSCSTHNTSYQVTLYEVLRMKNCAKNCTGLRRQAFDFGRKGPNSTYDYHAECKACRKKKFTNRGIGSDPTLAWDFDIRS